MRAVIGNMEANVSSDGKSVEFAPPDTGQTTLHLKAFESSAAGVVNAPKSGAAMGPLSSATVDPSPVQRVDLSGAAGLPLVIAVAAIALVLRHMLKKGHRNSVAASKSHDERPEYDDEAERIAFTKRYGTQTR